MKKTAPDPLVEATRCFERALQLTQAAKAIRTASAHKRRLLLNGFATTREAAEHMGVSIRTVQRLAEGGVLSHSVHGGRLVLPWAAVLQYEADRLVVGSVA